MTLSAKDCALVDMVALGHVNQLDAARLAYIDRWCDEESGRNRKKTPLVEKRAITSSREKGAVHERAEG